MEKLPMCRICLAKNVPMYLVVNKNLHELYEKLTDIPFVTEDKRPILACLFCCTKLKQCFRLMRKCLEAEELFAQMMNENYEPNPLTNPEHFEFCSGFIRSPVEQINIVDRRQTESVAIKEELPAVYEGLDDVKENQSDEYLENEDNSCLDVKDMHLQHSESDSEFDVPLIVFKTEEEEAIEVSKNKQRAVETNSAPVTKTTKLEDTITADLKKNEQSHLIVFRKIRNRTSKPGTSYKEEPGKCNQLNLNRVKTLRQCSQNSHLTKHIQIQTGEKPYKCDVCQHSFSRKALLAKHIRIHTGEKPYTCEVCQRSFSELGSLTKHIRIHTGEKPYKCDVCRRSFIESGGLRNHIRIHTGEKPYKCDVCQRSFSESGSLRKHIRIHTGEKPYKCDVCERSFIDKSSLRKHFRIHTGEKPYNCDICQRSFSQMSELTRHLRIHTGEKPYKCEVCQKRFTIKGSLTKHIRIHTGEKPYNCDVCQRSFSQKNSLNTHILKHTAAKP